jgi:superfamily II DNA or RNA helicase
MTNIISKNLRELSLKPLYITIQDDVIQNFYSPCLDCANEYSRAVGYFRSSIFLITGESIVSFAKRGGKIRLICSPSLTFEDAEAIKRGIIDNEVSALNSINNDLQDLIEFSKNNYSVNVLATLLRVGTLEIKIAIRNDPNSIYHDKLGIFTDNKKDRVVFKGSANETLSGFHINGNSESIDVFCSWNDERENERIKSYESIFEQLWRNNFSGVRCIDFPLASKEKFIQIAEKDLEEINIEKLVTTKKKPSKGSIKKIENLLNHQINAIELWKKNGFQGIFKHATGSGKTVTALAAINEHCSAGSPSLVLVPSKLLLKQWISELEFEIPDAIWLAAGAGNNNWKKNNTLKNFIYGVTPGIKRIVVATMQTASTQDFLSQIKFTDSLLLVADEVHQIGSPFNAKSMGITAEKKLGLSATPERYGDPLGTEAIFNYFGNVLPPIISLYDAIQAGRLVQYEYFPQIVHLTSSEAENWKEISLEIKKEIAIASSGENKLILSNRAKMLLIERARIAKKSSTKTSLAIKLILENFNHGESWLIYCEDQNQLKEITSGLRSAGISPLEYYSEMDGNSNETLKLFQIQGGILVSIRCLDEGIDIPSISHALILASSQNPRQFIQRRGRVLRKHPSKIFAKVYDVIVVPTSLEDEPEQFSLLKSELTRAYEFSKNALNISAGTELSIVAGRLGLDLSDIVDIGLEEDSDERE